MIRTAEFVTRAHPDKVCDQIADYLLDRFLEQDNKSRVAIEVMGSHGQIMVAGEVTTSGWVDVPEAVRHVLKDVGYLKNGEHYGVISNIVAQSPEIARGVDLGGAGDQGIMYGYATRETPEMLPLPYVIAREILSDEQDRDAKSQITMDSDKITDIVLSVSGTENVLFRNNFRKDAPRVLLNPAGPWNLCGFDADTGLTGRKLGVDTYGGLAPHGGGAFSGKDPTKVDRSAAYMARWAAKKILTSISQNAKEAVVGVAYAIGVAEPVMLSVTIDGEPATAALLDYIKQLDWRPAAIIERFDLRRPIYYPTAQAGHFTDPTFPWEQI